MEEVHVYESHLGGIFVDYQYDPHHLEICERCQDFDWYLGKVDTEEEFRSMVKAGGYPDYYIDELLEDNPNMFEEGQ